MSVNQGFELQASNYFIILASYSTLPWFWGRVKRITDLRVETRCVSSGIGRLHRRSCYIATLVGSRAGEIEHGGVNKVNQRRMRLVEGWVSSFRHLS